MKKFSVLILFIFTAFLFFSSAAISQDEAATDENTVKTEDVVTDDTVKDEETVTEDTEEASDEHAVKEDAATEHVEKVYEKEEISALKGKPKTFTDGYNTYVNDKVKFELFDIDNVMKDSIFYKIDDQQDQKYTEAFTLKDEGNHVVYYYSVDKMGNKEEQRSMNVIVDNTAPEVVVTITAPFSKNGETIYASDKFSYNYSIAAKDNIVGVASVEYAKEGDEYKEYVKPFTINSLEPVKITVNSEDKVGNLTKKYTTKVIDESGNLLSESIEDVKITVDNTAPAVEIKADKEFYKKDKLNIASKAYKYTVTATDGESGLKSIFYRVDTKSEFILYTGEIMFNTNGHHKIEAIAKDNVGNVSKTAVLDVFVDVIPSNTNIKLVTE